jgi:hypothetical protein
MRKKLGETETQSSEEMKRLTANCEAGLHVFGSLQVQEQLYMKLLFGQRTT